MTSSAKKKPIIEKLEYNYLIEDDISSLNTLMSLYDDKNFSNYTKTSYKIKSYIFKNLKKNFWYLADIDQIIRSLNQTIGEDLKRYEYLLSIKSEFKAFQEKKLIDKLEYLAIEYYGVSFLFEEKEIFKEEDKKVLEIKDKFERYIYEDKKLISNIRKNIKNYSDSYLKYKVLNIDINTNKQLAFDIDLIYTEDITLSQAKELNNKLITYFYNIAIDVCANSYWRGLCKEVINRYH